MLKTTPLKIYSELYDVGWIALAIRFSREKQLAVDSGWGEKIVKSRNPKVVYRRYFKALFSNPSCSTVGLVESVYGGFCTIGVRVCCTFVRSRKMIDQFSFGRIVLDPGPFLANFLPVLRVQQRPANKSFRRSKRNKSRLSPAALHVLTESSFQFSTITRRNVFK